MARYSCSVAEWVFRGNARPAIEIQKADREAIPSRCSRRRTCMIRAHQPGSQPIDIPEAIPNPAVPQPVPTPSQTPKEPVKAPAPQGAMGWDDPDLETCPFRKSHPAWELHRLVELSCFSVARRLRGMGIRDKPISAASPGQNCFAERLIGPPQRKG